MSEDNKLAVEKPVEQPLVVLRKHDLDVALFAAVGGVRPMLQHVLVQRSNDVVRLVATDSYVAVIYTLSSEERPDFKSFLIPADRLLYAKKFMTSQFDTAEIYKSKIVLPMRSVTLEYWRYEDVQASAYPDVEKALEHYRKNPPTGTVAANKQYLQKVINFVGSDRYAMPQGNVQIVTRGKLDPIEVSSGNTFAAVMPVRTSPDYPSVERKPEPSKGDES